ncbi:hypothetical protein WA026_020465 [Henosepilachna vigintioctopunctata]|uniref:Uncharacterized protein n=1 Tax=Henosepilachna vigintioctopunctata TaxID=420089 RepID=A0AAW1VAS4_9CUCU
MSDHLAQELKLFLNFSGDNKKKKTVLKHQINDENIEKFKELLIGVNWSNVMDNDPDEAYENFHVILLGCFEGCFPIKETIVRGDNRLTNKDDEAVGALSH